MLCGLSTGQQKENWMSNENMLLPILAEAVKLPGISINSINKIAGNIIAQEALKCTGLV